MKICQDISVENWLVLYPDRDRAVLAAFQLCQRGEWELWESASAIDPYAFQLSGWLETEAAKSRKQRRSLKQFHEDLLELGFKGSYDRVATFARQWREGQTVWVNSARNARLMLSVLFEWPYGIAIPAP